MKIMFKLIISLMLVGILPMAVMTYISVTNSKETLQKRAFEKLEAIQSIKTEQIRNYFETKKKDLMAYSANTAVVQACERFTKAFYEDGMEGEDYKKWDAVHGKKFEIYVESYGYYDLFIISPEGDVVYTVAKEADLGQNLISGELANTGLGRVFKNGLNDFAFADFDWYAISNEPAGFIAKPVVNEDGEMIAVFAFQLPLKQINSLMQARTGMGETGETYLVGADKRMRSDSYLDPKGHSVQASFEGSVEKNGVDTEASREALEGKSDTKIIIDYNGNPVLSAFSPLNVFDQNWACIAEIDLAEVNIPADEMQSTLLWVAIILVLVVIVIALLLAMQINGGIKKVISQINALINNVKNGRLDARGDVDTTAVDFKPIVGNVNELVDAFVAPINVTAEYVDRISKGDIPPKITEEYKGDFNEIKNNLNAAIDVMNGLLAETNKLISATKNGQLDARGNADQFVGGWGELVTGVNDLVDAFVAPINVTAEYVDRISKGDIPPKITDDYKGDFNEIKNNLNSAIDVMNGLLDETNKLINATRDGKLDMRGNSDKFVGGWGDLVSGINDLVDAFVHPINVTAEYIDRISKGDLPPKITDDYKGDFNEIKNNLNQCIDSISTLVSGINTVIADCKVGKLNSRADASTQQGDYRVILSGVNQLLDVVGGLLDDLPIPVMSIDNDFNILFMNKVGCSLGQTSCKDLSGTKCYDYFKTSQCQTQDCACFMSMRDNKNVTQETDAHPAGMDLEISYSAVPITDDSGKAVGAFEVVINQTEVKKALRESEKLAEDVKREQIVVQEAMQKAEKVAAYQNRHAEKLTVALSKVAEGDLDIDLALETADTDTGETREMFETIFGALNQSVSSLVTLKEELTTVIIEQKNGDLEFRCNANTVEGAYSELLSGVNELLDAVIAPVLEGITIMGQYAEGDLNQTMRDLPGKQILLTEALNKIKSNLKSLVNDSNMLALAAVEGQLETRADAARHLGEYQTIIAGVNRTLDAIIDPVNEAASILEQMATGDMTALMEGDYKGDHQKLKDSINTVADSLNEVLSQVAEAVQSVSSAAVQISSTSDTMAAAAEEQSAQADEVASAVEEMSRTITENAMSATKTSEVAQRNGDVAKEGGGVVEQTVIKMRDIAAVVKQSAENIEKLGESSKEIGEIISVIDDIADQTNLLALNAAIEAARAGEQGRGFAVVADEVRKLAERTTEATKQIADMIKGIQRETQEAVTAMKRGNEEVSSGIDLADKAGESLREIVASSQEVLDSINQIAAASEEQSSTSEQIAKNVNSISQVTGESARRIQDIASSSDELTKLTELLKELMSQFKIRVNSVGRSKNLSGNRAEKSLPPMI